MRLLRKLILGLLLIPVVIAMLLTFLVWLDTDFNHTRQQIESSFRQFTGHSLVIKGGLSLEFWPVARFISQKVEVTDNQGKILFTAEKLGAEVSPLSIISGKLPGENLVLEKVQVNLVRETGHDGIEVPGNPITGNTGQQRNNVPGMPFKSVRVIDSTINIDDRINQKQYQLNNLQIELELVSENKLEITGSFDFIYENALRGSFSTSLKLALGDQLLFDQVKAQLDLIVKEKPLVLTASGAFSLGSDGRLIQIREALFEAEALELQASLKARQSHESLALEAEIDHFNPQAALSILTEPGVFPIQSKALQSLSAQISLQKTPAELRLEIPSIELDNSLVQGNMIITGNSKQLQFKIDELFLDPYLQLFATLPLRFESSADNKAEEIMLAIQFNRLISTHGSFEGISTKVHLDNGKLLALQGKLNANKLNLNGLLKSHEALMPRDGIFSKLQAGNDLSVIDGQLEFNFENDELSVSEIDLKIDDTTIKGTFEYSMALPDLTARLEIGQLDLDRYQYLFTAEEKVDEESSDNNSTFGGAINGLKSLRGSGSIKIEALRHNQTDYRQIDIQFNDV